MMRGFEDSEFDKKDDKQGSESSEKGNMADRNSGDSYTSYEDITKHTSCLKLTDFGLSHIISDGDKVTFAKFACGTHNYKAPELINVYIF